MYWILVQLSQRKLFLYQDNRLAKSYPVGIGKKLTRTPVGNYSIVSKVPYPYSRPGGRLTPYGTYWLGLSRPGYGIHGTNQPWSIGKIVSHGCIRMHNQNVEELARIVQIGTPVRIRN